MNPLSGVLSAAWGLYRRYAPHFVLIAFAISLVTGLLSRGLGSVAGTGGTLLGLVVTLVGGYLVQTVVVRALQDVREGQDRLDLRRVVEASLRHLGPVLLASVVASIGIGIGFAALVVPGLVLYTFWSLIVPEIVIGGAAPLESLGRSWRTVRGNAWPVFGVLLVVPVVTVVAQLIVTWVLGGGIIGFTLTLVVSALLAPLQATLLTLVYYRLTAGRETGAPAPSAPYGGYGPY